MITARFYKRKNLRQLMRGMRSCRKHNIHSRQPPEQHKTKTRKQHECKWLKNSEDTQKNKQTFIKGKKGVPPWNGQ